MIEFRTPSGAGGGDGGAKMCAPCASRSFGDFFRVVLVMEQQQKKKIHHGGLTFAVGDLLSFFNPASSGWCGGVVRF